MTRAPIFPVVLLALATLSAGCGEEVTRRKRIELRFAFDFDRAIREGRIPADADREQVFDDAVMVVRMRLDRTGVDVYVRELGHEGFDVAIPVDQRPSLESIVQTVTAMGELEFRIEVLPAARYRGTSTGKVPPRLEQESTYPWQGTVEEFSAFKDEEVRRLKAARAEGTVYTPSDPRYFVVPRVGTEASDVHDFALLEEPRDPRQRFDGTILEHPRMSKDPTTGRPLVLYDIKAEHQDAFESWTGENVGLPVAIVLDEVCRAAPVLNGALRDSVQISLGSGPESEVEKEAEDVRTVLETGSLPVQPVLVVIHDPEKRREER